MQEASMPMEEHAKAEASALRVDTSSTTDVISEETMNTELPDDVLCVVCGNETTDKDKQQCETCHIHVHDECVGDSTSFNCQLCSHGILRQDAQCIICCQATPHTLQVSSSDSNDNTASLVHSLCSQWQSYTTDRSSTSLAFNALQSHCYICNSDKGRMLRCRLIDCARFFHPHCAKGDKAYMSLDVPFNAVHIYCDRHQSPRFDITTLLSSLASTAMDRLIGSDKRQELADIRDQLQDYSSVMNVLEDMTKVLVRTCIEGKENSKKQPKEFPIRHLQALQLYLDQVRQLEYVYDLSSLHLVQDTSLQAALRSTFDPSRHIGRFNGPVTQIHACDVCKEPIQQRQHIFHCQAGHEQHWKCTKRQSVAREKPASSPTVMNGKKTISMVRYGMWEEVEVPKEAPSLPDRIVCSVCKAPVVVHSVLGSRQDQKDVEKSVKRSSFKNGGAYLNPVKSVQEGEKHAPIGKESRRGRRPHSFYDTAKELASIQAYGCQTSPGLQPQKMERVHVKKTTQWLGHVQEVIRLASSLPSTDDTTQLWAALADQLEKAKSITRPNDPYALHKLETAETMLQQRKGPALAILQMLCTEYTRFVYLKHSRAAEKVAAERKKREEQEARKRKEQERKRLDREAEQAIRSQMQALRKKRKLAS